MNPNLNPKTARFFNKLKRRIERNREKEVTYSGKEREREQE